MPAARCALPGSWLISASAAEDMHVAQAVHCWPNTCYIHSCSAAYKVSHLGGAAHTQTSELLTSAEYAAWSLLTRAPKTR
jgi:hypothetical protein